MEKVNSDLDLSTQMPEMRWGRKIKSSREPKLLSEAIKIVTGQKKCNSGEEDPQPVKRKGNKFHNANFSHNFRSEMENGAGRRGSWVRIPCLRTQRVAYFYCRSVNNWFSLFSNLLLFLLLLAV